MNSILTLTLLGLGCAHAITLKINQPQDFQVYQRQRDNSARITLQASIEDAPNSPSLKAEWQFISPDGKTSPWSKLDLQTTSKSLSKQATLQAKPGWYQISIRLTDGSTTLATAEISHVGVGEVFIVAGQSNSGNYSEEKTKTETGNVAAFSGENWSIANDPIPNAGGDRGSFMPAFGDRLFDAFNVPIAFVPCGVGGTSVRNWASKGTNFTKLPINPIGMSKNPDGSCQTDGQLFNNLVERMKKLGPTGYRAVIWHQGESDSFAENGKLVFPASEYEKTLTTIIRKSKEESATSQPWFVAQVSYHGPQYRGSEELRATQAKLWKDKTALQGPNTDLLMEPFRQDNGHGIHFSGKGQRELAKVWADCVIPWLKKQQP